MLDAIRIVLVSTSHPGNIGAVARAMKNMGLSDLALVQPKQFPSHEATARASGADDLLAQAKVFDSLDEALADCRLVIGTSARSRAVQWPLLDPRSCAERSLQVTAQGPVALVFGRENSGLTNAELDRCQYLVHIPTSEVYSSLNLAMAVQVLAYELRVLAISGQPPPVVERERITADQFEGLIDHLEQTLYQLDYADERQSEKLMRRLRSLFHRADLDRDELNILRGILAAVQAQKS